MRQRMKDELTGSGHEEEDGCSTQVMTPLVAFHGPSILLRRGRGLSRDRKGEGESESSVVNRLLIFFHFYRLKKVSGGRQTPTDMEVTAMPCPHDS